MSIHKDISLKIEYFSRSQDIEFRIKSKKEMLYILQDIAEKGTRVALYYDEGKNFILATLYGANEDGIWLDVGPSPQENKRVLLSDKITLVSLHQHVKVQLESHDIKRVLLDGDEAFFLELPEYLLRIQRRDNFRIPIPASTPVKCRIPIKPFNPDKPEEPEIIREVPVLDVSSVGLSLLCDEHETELKPGRVFPGCQIQLPDSNILRVNIEVKNNVTFTGHDDSVAVRAGCQIGHMDNQVSFLLQNYINHLQSELLAKGLSNDT